MKSDDVRDLLEHPVVVAPMAGGPSAPALVIAGAQAGALAFLAAGYKSADAMEREIRSVREGTTRPFGVNVFVPGLPTSQPSLVDAYLTTLRDDAARLQATLGNPTWDEDDWTAKIASLRAAPVDVVSFTFGCPPEEMIRSLQDVGTVVMVTVTNVTEALASCARGADALCVQGVEAGAHRGTFVNDETRASEPDVLTLVRGVIDECQVPVVAAGGVMSARDVAAVRDAGAIAAQCGTAFLRCVESGAHPLYKDALGDPRFTETVVTRAFSGRPARGLVNAFLEEHIEAPAAYPEINNATRGLRAAAASSGDVDRMSLWAGVKFREATTASCSEILERLGG